MYNWSTYICLNLWCYVLDLLRKIKILKLVNIFVLLIHHFIWSQSPFSENCNNGMNTRWHLLSSFFAVTPGGDQAVHWLPEGKTALRNSRHLLQQRTPHKCLWDPRLPNTVDLKYIQISITDPQMKWNKISWQNVAYSFVSGQGMSLPHVRLHLGLENTVLILHAG